MNDRWNNAFPVVWEGNIPEDKRLYRIVRVGEHTAITQVADGDRWLVLSETTEDPSEVRITPDLVLEAAILSLDSKIRSMPEYIQA